MSNQIQSVGDAIEALRHLRDRRRNLESELRRSIRHSSDMEEALAEVFEQLDESLATIIQSVGVLAEEFERAQDDQERERRRSR